MPVVHGLALLLALAVTWPYVVGLVYFARGSRTLHAVPLPDQPSWEQIPITFQASASASRRLDEAISALHAATYWNPYYAQVYSDLAQAYLLRRDYGAMRAALKSLGQFPTSSTPERSRRLMLYARLQDLSSDGEQLKRDWTELGLHAVDLIQMGRYYERQEQNELAVPLYTAAFLLGCCIRDQGRGEPVCSPSDVWFARGRILEWSGQQEEALQAYLRAAELNNYQEIRPSDALLSIGVLYRRKRPQDLEAALRWLEAALQQNDFETKQEKARCHYQRGEVLQQMGREPAEYIEAYQTSIRIAPLFERAHLKLGIAYFERLHDLTKAEQELRIALQLRSDMDQAYFYLGEIHAARGERAQAIQMYQKALALSPANAQAKERLEALGAYK